MNTLIQGEIIDFAPLFKGYVRKERLVLGEEGDIFLTVDTGFSGGIALPQKMLDKM
jgi:predicted aspartyl protease